MTDSIVLRYPRAVTHFSPGSYKCRPLQVSSIANVFMAGDYVRGVDHGAQVRTGQAGGHMSVHAWGGPRAGERAAHRGQGAGGGVKLIG